MSNDLRMDAGETDVAVLGNSSEKISRMPSQRPSPKSGDVLASRPTARADVYTISLVPAGAKTLAMRYDEAMQMVRQVARALAVDGWYTCDHTHFARVASHRDEIEPSLHCAHSCTGDAAHSPRPTGRDRRRSHSTAARRMARPMTPPRGSIAALPHDLPVRILDGSPDAILICDRAGRVRYWNASAQRVFGFRVTEALGLSMDLLIPERLRARHWDGWEAAMRRGTTRYDEGRLLAVPALHKDGRQISIEFSIQLVKDADGQIEWVVAIIRDVTERFIREKDLRVQLKALQAKTTGQHSMPR